MGSKVVAAKVCGTLREAADSPDAPYFYENFLSIAREAIPGGERYAEWRSLAAKEMDAGKHLYYCGAPA